MQIKIKKQNKDGIVRLESIGDIKEVIVNEDLLHPDKESISLCFRGKNSSGIVDLSPVEFEKLYFTIKDRIHLIKGFKHLSSGSIILDKGSDYKEMLRWIGKYKAITDNYINISNL